MTFVVIWTPAAEAELAETWLTSPDRKAVTSAVQLLDQLLRHDPSSLGTPLFDTVRTVSSDLLEIDFEVVEADLKVFVLSIWSRPSGRG